jgi:hypothetical protein
MTSIGVRSLRRPLLRPASALAVAGGLLGPLGATAHADAIDDAFIAAIRAKGINFASPDKAIIAAHEVCVELNHGTPAQVAATIQSNSNLDGYHAGYFVGASIRAYCPEHTSLT